MPSPRKKLRRWGEADARVPSSGSAERELPERRGGPCRVPRGDLQETSSREDRTPQRDGDSSGVTAVVPGTPETARLLRRLRGPIFSCEGGSMLRRRFGLILVGVLLLVLAYPTAYLACRATGLLTRYEFQLIRADNSGGPTTVRLIGSTDPWTLPFSEDGPTAQTRWIDRIFAPCVRMELRVREIREEPRNSPPISIPARS